jgi:NAD(P)-dependent dehydrogenase (short-subunit alcohol dehydrogenase family)
MVALIRGGGRVIGRATAEIIGREGGTVVAVDNDKAALEQVLGAIRGAGGTAHGRTADALDAFQAKDVVRSTLETHGRIDILLPAVGGSTVIGKPAATVDELTQQEWQHLLDFNLTGTFLFINAVVPVMKRQRSGKIVCISSIAGRGRSPSSSAAYATAKGGIIALTKKLSLELGPYGINVNAIAPSLTLSPRLQPRWDGMSAEQKEAENAKVPLRRVAVPEDQARVICFLERRRLRHRCHHRRDGRLLSRPSAAPQRVSVLRASARRASQPRVVSACWARSSATSVCRAARARASASRSCAR